MARRKNQQKKGGCVMTQVATQNEIQEVINRMKEFGITPPKVDNKEGFARFNTEGCLNNSGYYYLTEGIRKDKSSYLMASFGCFDRGIDERICTLHEKPEGIDESFYTSSHERHLDNIKKQKAIYLDETNNTRRKSKVDIQADSERQTLEAKQNSVYSTDIEKTDSPVVNSFIMYDGFYAALESMPDDQTRLEYLDAICYYGLFRKTKEQSPYIKTLFALIKPQMDINFKRRKDGANGGRPKKVKAD
jgi:hypothetical protein